MEIVGIRAVFIPKGSTMPADKRWSGLEYPRYTNDNLVNVRRITKEEATKINNTRDDFEVYLRDGDEVGDLDHYAMIFNFTAVGESFGNYMGGVDYAMSEYGFEDVFGEDQETLVAIAKMLWKEKLGDQGFDQQQFHRVNFMTVWDYYYTEGSYWDSPDEWWDMVGLLRESDGEFKIIKADDIPQDTEDLF